MAFKPETNVTYEPLPEGDYPFVVMPPKDGWLVTMPEWKQEYALASYNERQEARIAEGKSGKVLSSIDELPVDRKTQIEVRLKVREGEYAGRFLPTVYLSPRFNTDPKWLDKSNWYKLLKAIVPSLKERAAKNDIPDFDEEVVGYGATATVEINDKGRNRIDSFRKDDSFGKRIETDVVAALEDAGFKMSDTDLPF